MLRKRIIFTGTVQGVGMRYFVYKTAISCGISGFVKNVSDFVEAEVQGSAEQIEKFLSLTAPTPWPIKIDNTEITDIPVRNENRFVIF